MNDTQSTTLKFHDFYTNLADEFKDAWQGVLAKITDPAKVAQVEKALADLAALSIKAKTYPDNAEAIAAEIKFPLATLASIAAEDVAVTRARFQEAVWVWSQDAAHFLVSLAIAAV